tara:strand:- start:3215 stop:3703 length:489 start_codon:yes stop_codon:yes gene_type:complete
MSNTLLKVNHITATTDAETIGDNKVICTGVECPGIFDTTRGRALLKSIRIIDEIATGPAIDILFSTTSDVITQDEGKSIGEDVADLDTVFRNMIGHVSIVAGDWTDLHDAKMATKTNIDLVLEAANNTDKSIYMHIVNRSGGNYVATATTVMKVKLGIESQR